MNSHEPVVLIADASEPDSGLIRSAFQKAGFLHPLHWVRNGDSAMSYLCGDGAYSNRDQFPLPNVLLLDLQTLRKHASVLQTWMQTHHELNLLPVYILSATTRPDDIERAYELGAHAYLVRPYSSNALAQMAKQLLDWLKINQPVY